MASNAEAASRQSQRRFHGETQSDLLARQYSCVAHGSEIRPGRFRRVSLQNESILVVRDENGKLSAFADVCLHRGSRLAAADDGDATIIRCPYHGWEYDAAGWLTKARLMQGPRSARLPQIDLIEQSGLVFLALNCEHRESFQKALDEVFAPLDVFAIELLKVAERRVFHAQVAWPLFVQNFVECYHCYAAHELLRRSEAFVELAENGAGWKIDQIDKATGLRARANGKPVMSLEPSADSPVFRAARTSTLNSDSETVDGALIGKPLGDLPIGDRAFVYGFVGPLTHFTVLPDQLVVFTFDPTATDHTRITVTWLVHRHTSLDEGAIENMAGFWSRTLSEDIALTEAVQQNAGSRFMPSACFAALEQDARIFSAWLKRHMIEGETDHDPVQ